MKRLCALGMFAVAAAIAAKIPLDATDAHRRADAVLYPRLLSSLNEYSLDHGGVNDPGHFDKLDSKDVENIRAIRETFTAWNEAMKQAGYR
jgi:hypothetical protein